MLTFTLVGSAAVAACSSSSGGTDAAAGKGGTGGGGGGTGGGGAGAGGKAGGGGNGGTGGATDGGTSCTLPLPEDQIVVDNIDGGTTDTNSHIHTVIIDGTILNSTTQQVVTTSLFVAPGADTGHTHDVTFSPANLATLRGGGQVQIRCSLTNNHTHTYVVACHAVADAGIG